MELSLNFIIYSSLFAIGQYLDFHTTYMGTKGLSKEELQKRELNPIVKTQIQNKKLVLAAKVTSVSLLLLVISLFPSCIFFLKLLAIFTFLTVANNIQSYWAEKHKKSSDFQTLVLKKLGIPKKFWYLTTLGIKLLIAFGISLLLP